MKKTLFIALSFLLILTACGPSGAGISSQNPTPIPPAGQSAPAGGGACGDGACGGPENAANCPADCAQASSGTGSTPAAANPPASVHAGDAPLYMTTMTHMEVNFTDDRDQGIFMRHVEELRYGMDLAEEYGAILTIESEKPFARANTTWNLNIMAEIQQRGFGVGTHCDIGYNEPAMSVDQFAAMFTENKALVDALIGAENNLGCSGGGSVNDWALAASQAGFKYLDGIVGMHYLAMPVASRPGPEWTDTFIRGGNFHLNAPVDMDQRIYPFGVANALDFNADPNPVIVVSSGELGLFSALAEQGREYGGGPVLHDDEYTFDNADVDKLVSIIEEVDRTRDRSRIAKLCVYLPANAYLPQNETVLRYFFGQMQALAARGTITWATQRQVYEAYVNWSK
jgi:hypothetical protein